MGSGWRDVVAMGWRRNLMVRLPDLFLSAPCHAVVVPPSRRFGLDAYHPIACSAAWVGPKSARREDSASWRSRRASDPAETS
jgi:hypothetical protein